MKGQSYAILAIVFVIIIAVFAVINVSPVEVNYLFWQAESPLILIILFSVLMGGLITGTAGMLKFFRMQRNMKNLKLENEELKNILQKNGLQDQLKEIEQKPHANQNKENHSK